VTTSVSVPPAKILRTASGREASRWVLDHCRSAPVLPIATVLATVVGAVLQIVPVFLLGTVVDGVTQGRDASILWSIGIATVVSALAGAVMTAVSTYLVGRVGAEMLARLREGAVRAVLGMPSARIEEVGRGDVL
jgi:ABC-type bacteriocin/lantibiotic exporter with double-glycine peptidase domain